MDYSNFEKIKNIYLQKCKKTLLKIANELSDNNEINCYFLKKALSVFLINDFRDLEMVIYHDELDTVIENLEKYENIEIQDEIVYNNFSFNNINEYLLTKDALVTLDYYIDCISTYIFIQVDPELNKNNPNKVLINKNTAEWWKQMIVETRIPFVDMNFANFNMENSKYRIYTNAELMQKNKLINNDKVNNYEYESDSDSLSGFSDSDDS